VIYRVPPDLTDEDLQELKTPKSYLHEKVQKQGFELVDNGFPTVLSYPPKSRVGYLFKVKSYIPKPLRCFNCNRFGHVASNCRGKKCCSNCAREHEWKECSGPVKCQNCGGEHSASDKICPRFTKESGKTYPERDLCRGLQTMF